LERIEGSSLGEMMRILRKAELAFTLIELVVAVAIAAILAAIAFPSYQESVRKAKRAEGRAALMELMHQEERYFSQNNTYVAFSAASSAEQEKQFRWYSASTPQTSAYEMKAEACPGDTVRVCVLLTAMPGTGKVDGNFKDPVCGQLTLDSTGAIGPATPECQK
jgi:type IV pilus assembly protein PilE